jgi:hypothetical protein
LFDVGGQDGLPAVKAEFRHLKAKLSLQAELGKSWEAAYASVLSERHLFPRVLQFAYIACVLPANGMR